MHRPLGPGRAGPGVFKVSQDASCQRGWGVRERGVSGEEARDTTGTDHERPAWHSTDGSFHSHGDGNHAEVCSRKMTLSI